ncbi:MAG: hypothetical protein ABL899_00735 [Nitrospira sp.]
MKNKEIKYGLIATVSLLPTISFAALDGLKKLLIDIRDLMDQTVPVLYGLCLIYFFWGLSQFILKDAGNEKTREDGKKKMIWGVIALFVFLAINGIIGVVGNIFGIPVQNNYQQLQGRQIPGINNMQVVPNSQNSPNVQFPDFQGDALPGNPNNG